MTSEPTTVPAENYWRPALPLIAILRGIRPEETLEHVGALIAAGFDAIEIPLNSPDWQASVGLAVQHFGRSAWIGGGTVLRTEDVDILQALGARVAVAPNTQSAVIRRAVEKGLMAVPGASTPTEAFEALDAGAQALKIFPASAYGPGFARALRVVLPPMPLYAVGGITPENLAAYMSAGYVGAGLGSQLYQPSQPVLRTESMAKAYLEAYREATR